MTRAIPIVPTILVIAAAGVMVWLGFWQLGRAEEKTELIALYESKISQPGVLEIEAGNGEATYRNVKLSCETPREWQAVAGRNENGRTGYAHRYLCSVIEFYDSDPRRTYVDIGWSTSPQDPGFVGGTVAGILVEMGDDYKVVAQEPMADLQPLAKPDPNDLPNNHLAYAGQWFFFALTALVIYAFALKSRAGKRG